MENMNDWLVNTEIRVEEGISLVQGLAVRGGWGGGEKVKERRGIGVGEGSGCLV